VLAVEHPLGVNLPRARAADEVHRDVGVDEDHARPQSS